MWHFSNQRSPPLPAVPTQTPMAFVICNWEKRKRAIVKRLQCIRHLMQLCVCVCVHKLFFFYVLPFPQYFFFEVKEFLRHLKFQGFCKTGFERARAAHWRRYIALKVGPYRTVVAEALWSITLTLKRERRTPRVDWPLQSCPLFFFFHRLFSYF